MFEEDYSSDILQALTNEFVKDLPSDFLQKLENIDHIDISTALNEVDSSEFHSHSIDSSTRPAGATDLYALSESEAYQVSSRSDVHTIPQELPITERYNKECHCFDCQNAFAQFNVKIPAIPCLPSAVTDNRTFIPSTQNRWNTTFEFSTFNRSPILAVPNNLKLNTKYNNFKPEDFSAHPQTLKEATKMLTAEIPEGVKVNTEYISKTMREWLWVSKISKDTFITNILECNSTTYTRYLHLPPSFEEMDKFSYQREIYRVLYNWISFPEEVKHQIVKLKILDQKEKRAYQILNYPELTGAQKTDLLKIFEERCKERIPNFEETFPISKKMNASYKDVLSFFKSERAKITRKRSRQK